jgi:DNA ligase (NAD+)
MSIPSLHNLEAQLLQAQAAYDAGKPIMTDAQFDDLVEQVRLRSAGTSRVLMHLGAPSTDQKVRHVVPCLSLEKVKVDQLVRWTTQRSGPTPTRFIITPKYDGISIALQYNKGKLIAAATRGDGREGDDVLGNIVLTSCVPASIRNTSITHVRGELIMTKSSFELYKDEYANARNLVAGLAMRKSGDRTPLQHCTFIAYEVAGPRHATYTQDLDALRICGFTTAFAVYEEPHVDQQMKRMMREHNAGTGVGSHYELDGYVVRMDDNEAFKSLGFTDHHPRGACAVKLADSPGLTDLLHVEWQVARTGIIAPVAHVAPVSLAGATVTKATLHNVGMIRALDLHIGDKISMTRRGAVIPQVEGVDTPGLFRMPIVPPTECPCCKSKVVNDGAYLKCMNDMCDERAIGRLLHWSVVTGMLGFGYETMRDLFEARVLRTPVDFYRVVSDHQRFQAMVAVTGMKIAQKLSHQIQSSRIMDLATFIQALGIPGVGKSTAEDMADFAHTIDDLISNKMLPTEEDLIEELATLVTIRQNIAGAHNGPFAGKNMVFTGALASMSREEAQAAARDRGAKTPDGLTRATDILVVGGDARDEQRGKRDKAEKYNAKGANIEVIDEDEFLRRLAVE